MFNFQLERSVLGWRRRAKGNQRGKRRGLKRAIVEAKGTDAAENKAKEGGSFHECGTIMNRLRVIDLRACVEFYFDRHGIFGLDKNDKH
jgi:hypothetical protein